MSTMQAPELLAEVSTVATADANGNATMTFQQPEAGWAWSGTIILGTVPPTTPVPSTTVWSVFVGGAFWGNYNGGAGAQVQARGASTVTVQASGLVVGNKYQAVWNGGKAPLSTSPFLAPFPGTTH